MWNWKRLDDHRGTWGATTEDDRLAKYTLQLDGNWSYGKLISTKASVLRDNILVSYGERRDFESLESAFRQAESRLAPCILSAIEKKQDSICWILAELMALEKDLAVASGGKLKPDFSSAMKTLMGKIGEEE